MKRKKRKSAHYIPQSFKIYESKKYPSLKEIFEGLKLSCSRNLFIKYFPFYESFLGVPRKTPVRIPHANKVHSTPSLSVAKSERKTQKRNSFRDRVFLLSSRFLTGVYPNFSCRACPPKSRKQKNTSSRNRRKKIIFIYKRP